MKDFQVSKKGKGMSKEDFTDEEMLLLCNMTSNGTPMNEAKNKIINSRKKANVAKDVGSDKKPTTAEKKYAVASEIEALGGEAPHESESLAKFYQTLNAVKEKVESEESEEEKVESEESEEENN